MTNEEAINYLHECSEAIGDTEHHTLSYAKEALNMAIKVLEQEPCEDAISRQAVLDLVGADWKYEGLESDIENLPSVNLQEPSDISNDGTLTVNVEDGRKISRVLVCGANHWGGLYYPDEQESKTEYWIKNRCDMYVCSGCNHVYTDLSGKRYGMNYCPNCGAKMESEE